MTKKQLEKQYLKAAELAQSSLPDVVKRLIEMVNDPNTSNFQPKIAAARALIDLAQSSIEITELRERPAIPAHTLATCSL